VDKRARILFEALDAVLEVWPSSRVGVKAGPMMSEVGAFRATDETLRTSEYVYRKIAAYKLSHMLLMRQMADLAGSPIEHMSGDAVVHHFRRVYTGALILNAGISRQHAASLIAEGAGDLVAFGRDISRIRILPNAYALMPRSMNRGRNIFTARPLPDIRTILHSGRASGFRGKAMPSSARFPGVL
jgi:2,4-dienoyl-CoA reductase-like NADH-dependent reductase (Old Yellow Enzyme family)